MPMKSSFGPMVIRSICLKSGKLHVIEFGGMEFLRHARKLSLVPKRKIFMFLRTILFMWLNRVVSLMVLTRVMRTVIRGVGLLANRILFLLRRIVILRIPFKIVRVLLFLGLGFAPFFNLKASDPFEGFVYANISSGLDKSCDGAFGNHCPQGMAGSVAGLVEEIPPGSGNYFGVMQIQRGFVSYDILRYVWYPSGGGGSECPAGQEKWTLDYYNDSAGSCSGLATATVPQTYVMMALDITRSDYPIVDCSGCQGTAQQFIESVAAVAFCYTTSNSGLPAELEVDGGDFEFGGVPTTADIFDQLIGTSLYGMQSSANMVGPCGAYANVVVNPPDPGCNPFQCGAGNPFSTVTVDNIVEPCCPVDNPNPVTPTPNPVTPTPNPVTPTPDTGDPDPPNPDPPGPTKTPPRPPTPHPVTPTPDTGDPDPDPPNPDPPTPTPATPTPQGPVTPTPTATPAVPTPENPNDPNDDDERITPTPDVPDPPDNPDPPDPPTSGGMACGERMPGHCGTGAGMSRGGGVVTVRVAFPVGSERSSSGASPSEWVLDSARLYESQVQGWYCFKQGVGRCLPSAAVDWKKVEALESQFNGLDNAATVLVKAIRASTCESGADKQLGVVGHEHDSMLECGVIIYPSVKDIEEPGPQEVTIDSGVTQAQMNAAETSLTRFSAQLDRMSSSPQQNNMAAQADSFASSVGNSVYDEVVGNSAAGTLFSSVTGTMNQWSSAWSSAGSVTNQLWMIPWPNGDIPVNVYSFLPGNHSEYRGPKQWFSFVFNGIKFLLTCWTALYFWRALAPEEILK
jgi:hypothetical protein